MKQKEGAAIRKDALHLVVYFKERAQIRRLDYQQTERVCRRPDRRRDELCQRDAHEYRHTRRDGASSYLDNSTV